jgi:putative pyruvate formate lyase activating enzyme
MQPVYIETYQGSKFPEKIRALNELLSCCTLCPRRCKVNRLKGEKGFCEAGSQARIAAAYPHFGEEACLVGQKGSGTVFFSYCSLKCLFCQNYEISHLAEGNDLNIEALATAILSLQALGCHNINLVTPTHFVPQIVEALSLAIKEGLNIPIVYNCGGYESEEVIDILDGVVDIYMPDAKFSFGEAAQKLCCAADYFENLKKVLKKMHRQVGDLQIAGGIARRGLLVRYLVMPEDYAGTKEIMEFIAKEISVDTYVNIMDQYRPCGQSFRLPRINRTITPKEYQEAVAIARSCGLKRFDKGN